MQMQRACCQKIIAELRRDLEIVKFVDILINAKAKKY